MISGAIEFIDNDGNSTQVICTTVKNDALRVKKVLAYWAHTQIKGLREEAGIKEYRWVDSLITMTYSHKAFINKMPFAGGKWRDKYDKTITISDKLAHQMLSAWEQWKKRNPNNNISLLYTVFIDEVEDSYYQL
jgi:hypothetical protein